MGNSLYFSGKGDIYAEAMDTFLQEEGYALSDYGSFGECSVSCGGFCTILIFVQGAKYGFDTDKPCIFLKINKVVDWAPLGIQADDVDTFFATVSFFHSAKSTLHSLLITMSI